ncbi:MAG: DUF4405 domain-containing protein [bacterium]|nr:DUF4405 domain-containing protein [bacterium]
MKRVQLNLYLNLAAYVLLLGLISTGLLMEFTLLPGSRGGQGMAVWGMTRHDWGDIHFYISLGFMTALLLHLYLHWEWILSTFRRFITPRNTAALSVVALISVAALAFPLYAPIERGVEEESGPRGGRRFEANAGSTTQQQEDSEIKGYMTFADIETAYGVPFDVLMNELGLQPDPALYQQRAGRALRELGVEMDALRAAVKRLHEAENQS